MKFSLVKKVLALIALYLVMTLTLYGLSEYFFAPKPTPPQEPKLLIQVDPENDWIRGHKEAASTLVEYGDYQSPESQEYETLLGEVLNQQGDHLKIVFRHFPEKDLHPQAEAASLAAEAAGKQGKFWEMHRMLFEKHSDWENQEDATEVFIGYATELKLNIETFKSDLTEEETQKLVDSDLYGGMASGVNGAPTFFLNGQLVTLPTEQETFLKFFASATTEN